MKFASNGRGGFYECKKEWPDDDCFVQCGGDGIVITEHKIEEVLSDPDKLWHGIEGVLSGEECKPDLPYYRTAFFEAFPRNPNTFIRGEGKNIEEAEEKCWKIYQAYFECDHPSFEARDYENGAGYCVKCGLWFPSVIPPFHPCQACGKLTWFSQDADKDFWCEDHYKDIPLEKMTDLQKMMRSHEE